MLKSLVEVEILLNVLKHSLQKEKSQESYIYLQSLMSKVVQWRFEMQDLVGRRMCELCESRRKQR